MIIFVFLCVLAIICALASVFVGVQIVNFLHEKGIKANPWMLKWMIFKYAAEYKSITLKETGTIGPLYTALSVILALSLLFAITAILVKVL
jgi:hypothetical protein